MKRSKLKRKKLKLHRIKKLKLYRIKKVMRRGGWPRSTAYKKMHQGLLPEPVKLPGGTTVAWVGHEIDMVISATIAGESADEIRALVFEMKLARPKIFESLKAQLQLVA